MFTNAATSFKKLGIVTIAAVYFLILVGGIVRSTGSGMGCPDWPKCFGSWVPPVSEAQLPPFYNEEYVAKRVQKNERIAQMLSAMGFDDAAYRLRHDPEVLKEAPFNATKTWIEYVNRLVGVTIGLLIIALFWKSLPLRRVDARIPWLSGISVLLVVFQGWLGSIVVSSNLIPFTITLHMVLAIVMVGLIIYTITLALPRRDGPLTNDESNTVNLAWVFLILSVGQTLLGTEVREGIDLITGRVGYTGRGAHLDSIGAPFYLHRSLAWLILAATVFMWWRVHKVHRAHRLWVQLIWGMATVVGISLLTGVSMAWIDVPAWAQPVHLLTGSLLSGLLLAMVFTAKFAAAKAVSRIHQH